jgi:flagellar basal-body rod modification protein FlgD
MAVNGVSNNTSSYTNEQMAAASRTVGNELGKDAFLKLLIAELSNQDPMNPMDDREFISQMAQFSSLEQMTNMTKELEGLSSMSQYSAVNYVGTEVAFSYEASDGAVTAVHDTVLAVFFSSTAGPILETLHYGNIPLKRIEGVTFPTSA